MKKKLIGLTAAIVLLGMIGMAQATLTVIGTATYNNGTPGDISDDVTCNLIWDDDNNGNSVVWLDYTNARAYWQNQKDWAAGLEGQLTYNIDSAYTVTWNGAWRLPATVDGRWESSCDGTQASATATVGYYFTNSELGHLYYTELGNPGLQHMSGGSCQDNPACSSSPPYGLQNTGPFDNLNATWYWSGTKFVSGSPKGWDFDFNSGRQYNYHDTVLSVGYGLALRNGQVVGGSAEYTSGPYNYYLPYFKAGDGVWTGLGLTNRNKGDSTDLRVTVYDNDGNSLSAEYKTIPAHGQDSFVVATHLNNSGWMQVNSHQPMSGLAFLGSWDIPLLMADIPFTSELSSCLVIPHIAQDVSWDTIILICNPNNEAISITLKYVDKAGVEQGTQNYTILAHGCGEYILSTVFIDKIPMAGSVEINSSNGIAAFALYTDKKSGGTYYAGINAESCE